MKEDCMLIVPKSLHPEPQTLSPKLPNLNTILPPGAGYVLAEAPELFQNAQAPCISYLRPERPSVLALHKKPVSSKMKP